MVSFAEDQEKLYEKYIESLMSGQPRELFSVGEGDFSRLQIGPGLITVFGGQPCLGKTALVMQLLYDAVRIDPNIRAVVCNVEMPMQRLWERQIARLARIDLDRLPAVCKTPDSAEREQLNEAIATVGDLNRRIRFLSSRNASISQITDAADEIDARIVVVDYIQRIGGEGQSEDSRTNIDMVMGGLRSIADSDKAVIGVASLARTKSSGGQSVYDPKLGLASFKGSSEIEYGADDAFTMASENNAIVLYHWKSRYGETRDFHLSFDRRRQTFTTIDPPARTSSGTKSSRPQSLTMTSFDHMAQIAAAAGR